MSQPAMIAMPSQISRKIIAEPRSGSANTSSAGTAAIASDVAKTRNVLTCSWLSVKYFASTRMIDQLADLGRLDVGAADVDPAARAVDLRAEREHEEQRADEAEVHAGVALRQEAVVELRDDDAGDDADDGEDSLTPRRAE